jgi:hypothetical protein
VTIAFPQLVRISRIEIQFQGGFAGKMCTATGWQASNRHDKTMSAFYPVDSNAVQVFAVFDGIEVDRLQIVFTDSTDFYGRITVYHLAVY